ncbi:MAG: hypothetical protein AB8H80_22130 [Planctomycetota bacterium]
MKGRARETFPCPHCGAEVVVGKSVCRSCGSDDFTGWQSSEEIDYQSIDIPDGLGPNDLDGPSGTKQDGQRSPGVAIVAVVLVICFVLWTMLRF